MTTPKKVKKSRVMTNEGEEIFCPPVYASIPADIIMDLTRYVVIAYDGIRCTDLMLSQQFEFLLRSVQLVLEDPVKFIQEDASTSVNICNMFVDYKSGDLKRSGIPLLRRSGAIHRVKTDRKGFFVYKLHTDILTKVRESLEVTEKRKVVPDT